MTEKQKKLGIIAIVIIGVLFLLLSKRAGGNTIVNQGQAPNFNVTIPSMNIPDRTGLVVNVPGLPNFTPYAFSPISPCMCNGAETLRQQTGPVVSYTTINNAGNSGPNVYNYAAPRSSSGGLQAAYNGVIVASNGPGF